MLWILLAILAHVANGAVFIVDKSLLGRKGSIGNPLQYALYSAALAGATIMLFPFAVRSFGGGLFNSELYVLSLTAGLVHIVALYVFFVAMRRGEPSRVVPITGSAVPFFTILFAMLFLREVFTVKQGGGMALLVVGSILLAFQRSLPKKSTHRGGILLPVVAGILFAGYFALTKYIYVRIEGEFLGIFIATRLAESLIAIAGLLILSRASIIQRLRTGVAKHSKAAAPRVQRGGKVLFVSNKLLAAGAFLLQTYAIAQGSVSVVNALQGVQYVFVFILAIVISRFFPKIFREELSANMLVHKIAGIACISVGIAFLV